MLFKSFIDKLFGKGSGQENEGSTLTQDGNGKKLMCVECKKEFLFESGEQQFYKMRGLTPPKRCPNCRSKRRRRR